jgi:hypothetical protein
VTVEFTTSYTPEQNGVAERLNRTLTTKIRAMLTEVGLPQWLWGEAAYTACYLHNRTPRYYPGYHVATPKKVWTGKKPDLGHLKVFGCVAYAQLAREQRHSKLNSTPIRGIFVGYTLTTRQYRVYNPEDGTIERYSTVRFDDERKGGTLLDPSGNLPPWTEAGDTQDRDAHDWDSTLPEGDTIVVRAPPPEPQVDRRRQTPSRSRSQSRSPSPPAPLERMRDAGETPARGQSRSWGRYQTQQTISRTDSEIVTPTSYEEAMSGPQREQWGAAIKNEMQSHGLNVVWTLVMAPKGANIVSCKWVFKIKRSPDGQIERYKARLVARGFSQQHGVDYDEAFTPVVRIETLRILLAIAAAEDLEIHQMDVVTAYLAGELEEEIYMTPPPGVPGTEGLVCRLRKGLYGLKQSARVWNQRLTGELKYMRLRATTADPSVWVSKDRGLILALYVNDIVLLARDPQALRRIKAALAQAFKMKDLGEI